MCCYEENILCCYNKKNIQSKPQFIWFNILKDLFFLSKKHFKHPYFNNFTYLMCYNKIRLHVIIEKMCHYYYMNVPYYNKNNILQWTSDLWHSSFLHISLTAHLSPGETNVSAALPCLTCRPVDYWAASLGREHLVNQRRERGEFYSHTFRSSAVSDILQGLYSSQNRNTKWQLFTAQKV